MKLKKAVILGLAVLGMMALSACTGPEGPVGPTGPTGPTVPAGPGDQMTIVDHFEVQADLDEWNSFTADPANIVISNDFARSGSHSVKFTVNFGDPWVHNGPRSQLFSKQLGYWYDGDEVWLAASFYFSSEEAQDPLREIISELHNGDGDLGVPFDIQSKGTNLKLIGEGFRDLTIPKKLDSWMDIVMHFKFSSTGQGLTEIYIDGASCIKAQNITNKDSSPVFWAYGLYKTGWKGGYTGPPDMPTKTLYVDDVRVGGAGLTLDDFQKTCTGTY